MSGASLSGIHAQAARLAAIANSVPSGDEDGQDTIDSVQSAGASSDFASNMDEASEAELAYNASAEAFDAGADIWAMLSVIQRD